MKNYQKKLINTARFTFIVCLLFFLLSCSKETKSVEIIPGWEILKTSEYTIQYPKEWRLDQSGQMGTLFYLFSPVIDSTDKFSDNINLMKSDLTGSDMDLDKFTELSISQIKTMITNSKIEKNERKNLNNVPFQHVIYTGDQGVYNLRFEQYIFIIDEKSYFITFTAEQKQYEKFKEDASKIMNSFVIH